MRVVEVGLLGFGYPASIAVLTRWVPVVREQRLGWLAVHHAGVTALLVGWALHGSVGAALPNAVWLVVSSVWYARGGRRSAEVAGAGR